MSEPPAATGRRFEGTLLVSVFVLALLGFAAPRVSLELDGPLGLVVFGLSFAALGAILLACAEALGVVDRPRWVAAAVSVAGLVLAHALRVAPSPLAAAAIDGALLTAGLVIGTALGARVLAAGHLVVVAYVSSLADVASVFVEGAPTSTIVASAPLLQVFALSFPVPGTPEPSPMLGVGDVVFVGLYFAVTRKFGLSVWRTLVALALGLASVFVLLLLLERAIPALPLLGLAMVIAHPEARAVPRHERGQAVVGLVAFTALVAWLFLRPR